MNIFTPTNLKRTLFFVLTDLFAIGLAVYLSFLLRFDFNIPTQYISDMYQSFLLLTLMRIGFFYLSDIYSISWRFFGFQDQAKITYILILSTVVFTILVYLFRDSFFMGYPRSVIPIEFLLAFLFLLSTRISKRFFLEVFRKNVFGKPTLIVASPQNAEEITRKLQKTHRDSRPVAIWNDSFAGVKINGVKVKSYEEIKAYHEGIEVAVISKEYEVKHLYEELKEIGVHEIKIFNPIRDYKEEVFSDISVEDLLARHPKDLDTEMIAAFIEGKRVLITGAGGSIGSEIVRQCRKFGAKALTLVESGEYNLYRIGEQVPDADLRLLSVTDKEGLEALFSQVSPDIVIHAAAYKHVPICEHNPESAVINNIVGTKNVIDVSIAHHVEKVVVISTDKAVRPTNVMGATKRVSELYAQNVPNGTTEIVAVRFGNVLGSSGSVIPKFKEQIEKGGPVTVTHPEMTRYFMLIPEACQLVLQAAAIAKGGELFILDMGEPVKIVDLARTMIRLYGKEEEIEITFTGLRPGEKMYEELLLDESEQKTKYSSIFVAAPTEYPYEQLIEDIEMLLQERDKRKGLRKIVPEYTPKENL